MTELKTLKDIDTSKDYTSLSRTHYEDFVCKDDLKAEAIKRAKYFMKMMLEADNFETRREYFIWKGRFDEAMEMNNLTEEDLK